MLLMAMDKFKLVYVCINVNKTPVIVRGCLFELLHRTIYLHNNAVQNYYTIRVRLLFCGCFAKAVLPRWVQYEMQQLTETVF